MMETLSNHDLIKQIKRYQHNIQQVKPPENDPERVLHYVRKLSKLPIKFEELDKTGVGKTINALRKSSGNVAEEATLLVAKWKAIVKKQVQEEDEEAVSDGQNYNENSPSEYGSPGVESNTSREAECKKVPEIQEPAKEIAVKYITLKKSSSKADAKVQKNDDRNSLDRKRKHSSDSKGKHKKEKYRKIEEVALVSSDSDKLEDISSRKEKAISSCSNSLNSKHDSSSDEAEKKKKRESHDSDRKSRKDLDKRHHKSSKHSSNRDEKHHHKHHSKSTHHDKKQESSSKTQSSKHRSEKKSSESKSKHDSDRKSSSSYKKEDSKWQPNSDELPLTKFKREPSEDSDRSLGNATIKTESDTQDDDFGAALLGISSTFTPKKKNTPTKYSSVHSSSNNSSPYKSSNDLDLLSDNVKLEPLQLDDYFKSTDGFLSAKETNVRDKPILKANKYITEEEALNSMTTTKNQRTKVFSGFKSKFHSAKFPTLFELCSRVLQDNFDALEYTGGVPFDVLKPILEKVTDEQLYTFENYNPYLIGETDELWEYHTKRHFRKAERQEYESWRDMYLRCVEEREWKLQSLTENISQSIANSTPVRKTKLAYLDSVVKPPRNVVRSQAKHGTGTSGSGKKPSGPQPSPTAIQSVKERLAKESMAAPVAIISSKNLLPKKKKAPLMQKTLQLFKGLKR